MLMPGTGPIRKLTRLHAKLQHNLFIETIAVDTGRAVGFSEEEERGRGVGGAGRERGEAPMAAAVADNRQRAAMFRLFIT